MDFWRRDGRFCATLPYKKSKITQIFQINLFNGSASLTTSLRNLLIHAQNQESTNEENSDFIECLFCIAVGITS